MFKKILIFALAISLMFLVGFSNQTLLFSKYSNKHEIYINSNSSNAQIVQIENKNLFNLNGVYGESFKAEKENFSLDALLKEYGARLIKTEIVGDIVCYYAYSPKIKYRAFISGQAVNLHVAVSNQVTVGSPLIFGGF